MKTKALLIIPILFIFVFSVNGALPIKTSVRPVASCPGEYVVGIQVENCYRIGAISLKLNYDAQNLTYQGYQNFNPILSNGMTYINAANGQVIISWASSEADSVGNDTLIELRFSSGTGTWPFSWATSVSGDCEYADTLGNILPSTYVNGNATVYQAPSIYQQPANKTTYFGNNTSFSVGASGTGLSFQWQISTNSGVTWGDLTNTAPYSGVNSPSLNVTSATIGLSGNLYRCRVSGACPSPVISNSAMLLVFSVINNFIGSASPCAGTVSVPVTVQNCSGVGAISLKILYNTSLLSFTGFQNINGMFSSGMSYTNETGGEITFSWANTNAINIGSGTMFELSFSSVVGSAFVNWNTSVTGNCEFSDIYGNIINSTYTNGTINTLPPPDIASNPANRSILAGQSTSFSVSASGSGLGHQWQISTNGGSSWGNLSNTAPYSGVTSSTLYITTATQGMSGYKYRCSVYGTCPPSVISNPASLTVTTPPTPVTTSVGSVSSSCTGNVSVPVTVLNCNNIGAISLVLLFDTTKMSFGGYNSVHSQLSNGFFYVNQSGNKVTLSCATLSPINISSGTLLNYRFIANPGVSTTLNWDTQTSGNCEFSDINGAVIPSVYNNGAISTITNALTVKAGNDFTVQLGEPVQLNGQVSGGVAIVSYGWSPSAGLTDPAVLNPIASPSATTTYRLSATGGNGCAAWDEALVTVVPTVPQNLAVGNLTIPPGSNLCFNASQIVTLAGNGSQFLIQPGGHADIIAGQKILLKNGTTVVSGGTLHGWITANGNYCNNQASFLKASGEGDLSDLPNGQINAKPYAFKIYPNPTTGILTMEFPSGPSSTPILIRIYNLMGAEVMTKSFVMTGKSVFSLESLSSGMYLMSVMHEGRMEMFKIIKQ
jgi:hypothetical protein